MVKERQFRKLELEELSIKITDLEECKRFT